MSKQIFFFSVSDIEDFKNLDSEKNRLSLGNKGANLAEMSSLGIPVPPGFILSTDICKLYNDGSLILENKLSEINEQIKKLESITDQKFGSEDNPLLLSVRSGAIVSMPGMMDTVLNIGLNDKVVEGLAAASGHPTFAYDSYRRLIQMYGSVVLNINDEKFDHILYRQDATTSLSTIKKTIEAFKEIIFECTGKEFPQDITEQLIFSIEAVFKSWNSDRAIVYRNKNSIDHNLFTAATVQAMVFGNMDDNSCTGVLFTRNPISGDETLFGEFLPKAQGEDVVSGYVKTYPLTKLDAERNNIDQFLSMEASREEIFDQLKEIAVKLEKHYCDMQDVEFTVQSGNLWILQTRNGKRSAAAAAKIAVDMVNEGLRTEEQALQMIDANVIEQSIHKQLVITKSSQCIAKGLAASPGAASGIIALTPQKAEILSKHQSVILIRNETNPDDIAGMYAADGILTGRGGVTSHAAVVARGIGKPCICSVENLIMIDENAVSINGNDFHEGDHITINGSTGDVFAGRMSMTTSCVSDDLLTIISWMQKHKKISVLANADTPEDLNTALVFGAEGIGLCRTEHMFFSSDRINDVRQMILAENIVDRKKFLKKLSEYQKHDFKELFKILDGKSICIRLLDPPLHEFLPQNDHDIEIFCVATENDFDNIRNKVRSLYEHNPMLGHRGCRLAITYPEIYEAQASAIFHAMAEYKNETAQDANVEIMIPLVFSENELIFVKSIVQNARNDVIQTLTYSNELKYVFGTMIELPRTALIADRICDHIDFISFGTNDLTQTTFGVSRDDSSKFLNEYIKSGVIETDPFVSIDQDGVGELMRIAVNKIRAKKPFIKIGVCGEHGGDQQSINFFCKLGIDYVSCSPYRVPIARLTASKK